MKPLATFKPEDVEEHPPHFDYDSFKPRTAARAVVFDGDKVALIHTSQFGYYMLPGGGIDDDSLEVGLRREILEELGCEIQIDREIGSAVVYFDRWNRKQTDYCYIARITSVSGDRSLTELEAEEGHEVIWVSDVQAAIALMRQAVPEVRDGKLVRARDLLFLERAARMI